ncbi:hypothetical protein [Beijerinckia mobilis]|uniref:hypothetical protein n=1 Tax=Beijerinckia mobilis TaxID=231434 RepID=UPI000A74309D|nr:hypothetical protein [Beijerinckia mobilis]
MPVRDKAMTLLSFMRPARPILLATLLAVSLGALIFFGQALISHNADNQLIDTLLSGHDITIADHAMPEVLFARAQFLMTHNKLDEAQSLVDKLDHGADTPLLTAAQYNLANARLRKAFDFIENTRIDQAEPLVNLARAGYRRSLGIDPEFWDARYNLDVAMRLIRDFPGYEKTLGDEMVAKPKELWTDLPGKPKGLP